MLCDTHTHSIHSPDGANTVAELCEAAVRAGVGVLAITDHANIFENRASDAELMSRFLAQKEAILAAREQYRGKLKLLCGCELGEPQLNPAWAEEVLEFPFDMIIGSNHFWSDGDGIYETGCTPETYRDLVLRFLRVTKELIEFGRFHTLGHLDYILRYIEGCVEGKPNFREFEPEIEEILTMLVERGMAIEINTASLRYWLNSLIEPWILERFRALGGKYITIGSDAHVKKYVGFGIEQAARLAYETGFSHITYFEQGEPVQVSLKGV
ncbi:MAG: histidinol-phosphatase HisJ family protein [Ruminococcaceae bacterium]|nr:histidinol-phosphatase HisJ family protein [Oscillospiraceae bacterium]